MAKTTFGESLKSLMNDRGISGRELAKQLDLSSTTVSEWIGTSRIPRNPDVLKKIAAYFRVSIHKLLFNEEEPNNLIQNILETTEIHTGLYEISIKKVKPRK